MPGLTTVALPHYEMGQRAAERALKVAAGHGQNKAAPVREVELAPCRLVERRSVDQPAPDRMNGGPAATTATDIVAGVLGGARGTP